jgi:transcriptional regulator with XRE-family HTH domain
MQYETPDTLKKFGLRLRKLRQDKGLSLNMFAYENDLSKASVSKIERGIIDFRFSTLLQMANALEISLSELLDLEKEED